MEIRRGNFLPRPSQKIEKRRDIERVMTRREPAEISFSQLEQSHRWTQTPAVFGMRRVLEIFLEMDERARRLDQTLEKIVVVGVGVQPKVLQDVVRFVVTLFVPATKERAVARMLCYVAGKIDIVTFEVADELRNSFAFVHEAFNLTMPQMMGKPTFPEGTDVVRCRKQE